MSQTQPTRTPGAPAPGTFPAYYAPYVEAHPGGDVVEALAEQLPRLMAALRAVPADKTAYRYAEDKWSIEEVVGHIVDIERTFSYRAMCFTRGLGNIDQPGVDQDVMVPASGADARGLASLCDEFEPMRLSNIALFRSFGDAELALTGRASGATFDVRTVITILYGHAEHHLKVLADRYQ